MKKIIAFVLTVAMVLSVCAFSVSAETAPAIVLEGAEKVVVGDDYTVSVRINNADAVAGVQGELAYEGATVKEIVVNPQVTAWNNTEDNNTIVHDDENSVNFATLIGDLTGTRILIKVTFTTTADPNFTLENVKFSDDNAEVLDGTSADLDPAAVVAEDGVATLNKVGMLPVADVLKQGVVVNGAVEAEGVTEFGVIYYPTQLLGDKALTLETSGAIIAKSENVALLENEEGFDATLNFTYTDELKAAKILGVKISAVVYYKDAEGTHYSANSVDKYIQGGAASKAILNTAYDLVEGNNEEKLLNAKAGVNDVDNMFVNRGIILEYAIAAAQNNAQ